MRRDFSESAERTLCSQIREINNEQWYGWTDAIGDFFSFGLDIQNYLDRVDDYHKKIMDKNNTTVEDIAKIFADVRGVDASFQTIFSKHREALREQKEYIQALASCINTSHSNFTADGIQSLMAEPSMHLTEQMDVAIEIDQDMIEELKNKAEKDYKNGEISNELYQSIISGLLTGGVTLLKGYVVSAIEETGARSIVNGVYEWVRNNTYTFMNRGLAAETNIGTNVLMTEAPSFLTQLARGATQSVFPIAMTAIDYTFLTAMGKEKDEAIIKATAHTAISLGGYAAGAKIGGIIGTAIGGPIGTVAGVAIGVIGCAIFDLVYDNKDKIIEWTSNSLQSIGNAVEGLFGGIGNALFGQT